MKRRFMLIPITALALALAAGCQPQKTDDTTASRPVAKSSAAESKATTAMTGRDVLTRMVATYRAASSYSDSGMLRMAAQVGAEKQNQNFDFSVALVRPNKLRVMAYQVKLACDGQKLRATLETIPGQVLEKPAPATIDMKVFRGDPNLASSIADFAGPPPALLLLLSDDPMKALLRDAEEPKLDEPVQIEGHDCYRVKIKGPEGVATLCIDKESLLLRRTVYPVDALRQSLEANGSVQSVSLVADFTGASFNAKVDPTAFDFPIPPKAEIVKFFVPPHLGQLLGKPVPEFKFYQLDGKPFSQESLAGKAAVIDFWATWCGPCRASLPELQKVYDRYKDNPKIAFYAVSGDDPRLDNKELTDAFDKLKVTIPILRDNDRAAMALKVGGFPTTLVIDAKGVVQYFEAGANPNIAEVLPAKLDKVLAGENVYEPQLKQYEQLVEHLRQYAERLEKSGDEPEPNTDARVEQVPKVKPAPKSEPATIKLTEAWKSADVKFPGNVAVISGKDGKPRLAVVEGWKSIAEVGLDGKLIDVHKPALAEDEAIGNLRSAVGGDGKRYTVAWMINSQRCHVFDEDWKLVASYPENALQNPHSGIADVQIGDLAGDGKLKLYVGYWGVVGVQGASLQGENLWRNRSLTNVLSLAIGPAGEKSGNALYCTNSTGSIIALNDKGETLGEMNVPQRMIHRIVAADLRGDKKPLWCGLSAQKLGEDVAVGFALNGHELWNYPLPTGVPGTPIERIIPGRLTLTGPGQWILPGPDGSIHIISADGKPLDKWNTGVALQGVATVEINGQPALILASEQGVIAYKVE